MVIQREQYKLYNQRMPNSLTKKRFAKLQSVGFDNSSNNNDNENTGEKIPADNKRGDEELKDNNKMMKKSSSCNSLQDDMPMMKVYKSTSKNDDKMEQDVINTSPRMDDVHLGNNGEDRLKPTNGGNFDDEKVIMQDKSSAENNEKNVHIGNLMKQETDDEIGLLYNTTSSGKKSKLKGKCDICEKKDGFWGHNLQKCKVCHLLVHELCYGMRETKCKDPDFVCHACNAVGKEVEVNVPSKIGGCGNKMGDKRELIKQTERPTECLLCSHDKGTHAMHPLLDTHGKEGRQLVWNGRGKNGKKRRLAWVHTLCANVIGSNPRSISQVYGCDKDGDFYDFEEQEVSCGDEEVEFGSDDDDEKKKSDMGSNPKDEIVQGSGHNGKNEENVSGDDSSSSTSVVNEPTCYYTINTEPGHAKNINDQRRELTCFVCKKKDKEYRIPIQCPAGEEEEYGRWKGRHKKNTECSIAMHVGCARWGCVEEEGSHLEMIDDKRCKLCYFTPGRYEADDGVDDDEGVENQTVAHCYCKRHARDIVVHNPNRKIKADNTASGNTAPASKSKTRDLKQRPKHVSKTNDRPRTKKSKKQACASFKKSINTIRPRGGKKKAAPKRSSSNDVFGGVSKKPRFAEEANVQFPVKGRSASALASSDILASPDGASSSGPPTSNGTLYTSPVLSNSTPDPATSSGTVSGILKKMDSRRWSEVANGSASLVSEDGSRRQSLPDMPSLGIPTTTKTTQQISGKRKTGPVPDMHMSGSFKIMKKED